MLALCEKAKKSFTTENTKITEFFNGFLRELCALRGSIFFGLSELGEARLMTWAACCEQQAAQVYFL